jgi:hypothetical protein
VATGVALEQQQQVLQSLVAPLNADQLTSRLSLLTRAYDQQRHDIAQLQWPWCMVAAIIGVSVCILASRLHHRAMSKLDIHPGAASENSVMRPLATSTGLVIVVAPQRTILSHHCMEAVHTMAPAVFHAAIMLLVWLCFFGSTSFYRADAQLLWNSSQFDTPWGSDAAIGLIFVAVALELELHFVLSWCAARTWTTVEWYRVGKVGSRARV